MPNSRMKWVLVLFVLIVAVMACGKKEEAKKTEGTKETAQTEQKSPTQEQAPQVMGQTQEGMKQAPEGAMASAKGKEVYEKNCTACHAEGVAGAPKTGDKAAWSEHMAHGTEHMVENAVKGIGSMPPKGGNPALSEEDVRAAVTYMMEQSR